MARSYMQIVGWSLLIRLLPVSPARLCDGQCGDDSAATRRLGVLEFWALTIAGLRRIEGTGYMNERIFLQDVGSGLFVVLVINIRARRIVVVVSGPPFCGKSVYFIFVFDNLWSFAIENLRSCLRNVKIAINNLYINIILFFIFKRACLA